MDIIKFAMKMELDGKAFYEKQAEQTQQSELKKILLTLAEEEDRHFRFFKNLSDNRDAAIGPEEFSDSEASRKISNIFEVLAQNTEPKPFGEDIIGVWTEARRLEEEAVAFYREKAAEESDESRRNLLLKIAEEEYRHVLMIDNVLTWLKHPAAFAASSQYKNFLSLEGRQGS